MLAYWDTDLNKSVDFFMSPILILLVVAGSMKFMRTKILFKLTWYTLKGTSLFLEKQILSSKSFPQLRKLANMEIVICFCD